MLSLDGAAPQRCRADARRFLHDYEAGSFEVLHEPLGASILAVKPMARRL